MGVSGSGKTAIGKTLAAKLHWQFIDGDDLHLPSNIEKMRKGVPLTDRDRMPWLESIRKRIMDLAKKETSAIIACSALKESYRKVLLSADRDIKLVYLKGTREMIEKRLRERKKHFFDAALLSSQFEALEEPRYALTVHIAQTPHSIADMIRKKFGL